MPQLRTAPGFAAQFGSKARPRPVVAQQRHDFPAEKRREAKWK